jgi:hypothetical protein
MFTGNVFFDLKMKSKSHVREFNSHSGCCAVSVNHPLPSFTRSSTTRVANPMAISIEPLNVGIASFRVDPDSLHFSLFPIQIAGSNWAVMIREPISAVLFAGSHCKRHTSMI